MLLRASLEKERDDNGGEGMAFRTPCFYLPEPAFPNARVKDTLEFCSEAFVAKYAAGEFVTAQAARAVEDLDAKCLHDFLQSGLARLDDLAGDLVRID